MIRLIFQKLFPDTKLSSSFSASFHAQIHCVFLRTKDFPLSSATTLGDNLDRQSSQSSWLQRVSWSCARRESITTDSASRRLSLLYNAYQAAQQWLINAFCEFLYIRGWIRRCLSRIPWWQALWKPREKLDVAGSMVEFVGLVTLSSQHVEILHFLFDIPTCCLTRS